MISSTLMLALCFNSFDFEIGRDHTLDRNIARSSSTKGLVSNYKLNISSKLSFSLCFLSLNICFLDKLFFFFWNHKFFIDVKNSIVITNLSTYIKNISLCLYSIFCFSITQVDISMCLGLTNYFLKH